jgi:hypothetical protein
MPNPCEITSYEELYRTEPFRTAINLGVEPMKAVLEREPELCRTGFYHYETLSYWREDGEHRVNSSADYKMFFEQERACMLEPRQLHQFNVACAWLQRYGKAYSGTRPRFYTKASSYSLKHAAEWDMSDDVQGKPYITNGAFIAAAIAEGFRIRRQWGANCLINIAIPKPKRIGRKAYDVGGGGRMVIWDGCS